MGPLLNPKTHVSEALPTQNRSQLVADFGDSSGGVQWALAQRQEPRKALSEQIRLLCQSVRTGFRGH